MLETKRVSHLFTAARSLHDAALDQLEQGQLQKAGGKAWDATLQATNALILARTGQEPQDDRQAFHCILELGATDPALNDLGHRYGSLGGSLFEDCVCNGICEPEEVLRADLAAALDYIQEAERLAGV